MMRCLLRVSVSAAAGGGIGWWLIVGPIGSAVVLILRPITLLARTIRRFVALATSPVASVARRSGSRLGLDMHLPHHVARLSVARSSVRLLISAATAADAIVKHLRTVVPVAIVLDRAHAAVVPDDPSPPSSRALRYRPPSEVLGEGGGAGPLNSFPELTVLSLARLAHARCTKAIANSATTPLDCMQQDAAHGYAVLWSASSMENPSQRLSFSDDRNEIFQPVVVAGGGWCDGDSIRLRTDA
uniref:Uncharacterized protein n=1 Tax=Anopheles atroparvus TaxID=41427 RepID=A0A182JF66_ANOAO